jgi:hypothetical protein
VAFLLWWQDPDLNWGHKAFQASALPTELSRHVIIKRIARKIGKGLYCQEKTEISGIIPDIFFCAD